MPKQVRLRRGTTAQHVTFTGADGEVTFDSTKKILVVHDGVTAGGKPIEGFVKLDPGNTLAEQEIKGPLYISGGDEDHVALTVDNPVFVNEFTDRLCGSETSGGAAGVAGLRRHHQS